MQTYADSYILIDNTMNRCASSTIGRSVSSTHLILSQLLGGDKDKDYRFFQELSYDEDVDDRVRQ